MRSPCSGAVLALALLAGGCNYARMNDDEALQTHEVALPPMPRGTVPAAGGVETERTGDPKPLRSPLIVSTRVVEQGRVAYGYYCVHCHGPKGDGNGTVGQSFAPLPTDLSGPAVRSQTDGEVFAKVSLGFRRHPPLADTVSEADRWAVIAWLRTLPARTTR